jgi:hypothetical protein
VNTTTVETLSGRQLFTRIWKYSLRRLLFPICVLAPFAYYFPKIALFYALCGTYDACRNRPVTVETLRRYFIGNGVGTWLLSPINVLLDLLSLPYINKGVYRLSDLPHRPYQRKQSNCGVLAKADRVHESPHGTWRRTSFDRAESSAAPAWASQSDAGWHV